MTAPNENQSRGTKLKWALVAGLPALAIIPWLLRPPSPATRVESPVTPAAVARTNLALVAGRLCLSGQTNAFTGLMVEHGADGSLRSRSSVVNGLLHGLSQGWYTNGQLQVTEQFKEGVS